MRSFSLSMKSRGTSSRRAKFYSSVLYAMLTGQLAGPALFSAHVITQQHRVQHIFVYHRGDPREQKQRSGSPIFSPPQWRRADRDWSKQWFRRFVHSENTPEWREVKRIQNQMILHNYLYVSTLYQIQNGTSVPFSAFRDIKGKNQSEAETL